MKGGMPRRVTLMPFARPKQAPISGMAMTAMAGQVLAEAIAGTHERIDLFERIPHRDFPGGALLRTPALVLAMAWYRLRDWL